MRLIRKAGVLLLLVPTLIACGTASGDGAPVTTIEKDGGTEPNERHPQPGGKTQRESAAMSSDRTISTSGTESKRRDSWTHSVIKDATGDLGSIRAPGFADLISAKVSGRGDKLMFSMTFAADFPSPFGQNQNFIVGIGLGKEEVGEGRSDAAVVAQATRSGWKAAVQRDGESFDVSDRFKVGRRTLTWTLPAELLGAPSDFFWGASVRWLDFGEPGDDAVQAADRAPDEEPARYEEQSTR